MKDEWTDLTSVQDGVCDWGRDASAWSLYTHDYVIQKLPSLFECSIKKEQQKTHFER